MVSNSLRSIQLINIACLSISLLGLIITFYAKNNGSPSADEVNYEITFQDNLIRDNIIARIQNNHGAISNKDLGWLLSRRQLVSKSGDMDVIINFSLSPLITSHVNFTPYQKRVLEASITPLLFYKPYNNEQAEKTKANLIRMRAQRVIEKIGDDQNMAIVSNVAPNAKL